MAVPNVRDFGSAKLVSDKNPMIVLKTSPLTLIYFRIFDSRAKQAAPTAPEKSPY